VEELFAVMAACGVLDTARVARDLFDVNPHRGALTYEEFVHSFT
jgi:Ca2+-binding EF-hand superfamily protein